MNNVRILFMGTPDFAQCSLRRLLDEGFNVIGAVTQPDKPKGRGHKMVFPPVKETAVEVGMPVFQPESLKNGELKEVLDELKPDLIAVVAYGKILPEYILKYPKYGCINVHGSILPAYRGAAPIQRAVLNGERVTGVTTMLMNEGMDTGDILLTEKTAIEKYETSEHLFDRLADIGAELLIKTIRNFEAITPKKQDDKKATYAPIIKKEMAMIDWKRTNEEICSLICGMNSWPMAYTFYKGEPVKIISAEICSDKEEGNGKILGLEKNRGLKVSCGNGCIYVKEVQFSGRKRMNIEDYLRGNKIENGEFFGKE